MALCVLVSGIVVTVIAAVVNPSVQVVENNAEESGLCSLKLLPGFQDDFFVRLSGPDHQEYPIHQGGGERDMSSAENR